MAITRRMTRKFREDNCSHCKLADKKALKKGESHCGFKGSISMTNNHCSAREGQ